MGLLIRRWDLQSKRGGMSHVVIFHLAKRVKMHSCFATWDPVLSDEALSFLKQEKPASALRFVMLNACRVLNLNRKARMSETDRSKSRRSSNDHGHGALRRFTSIFHGPGLRNH